MKMDIIDIQKRLTYCPETGALRRKASGEVAGYKHKQLGYVMVSVTGAYERKTLYAHRIAWALMTGEWPKHEIDHINGIHNDNRWVNLREATRTQNMHNRPKNRGVTSKFKGVYFDAKKKKYIVRIMAGRKLYQVGRFRNEEEAGAAYARAAAQLHGEFARAA